MTDDGRAHEASLEHEPVTIPTEAGSVSGLLDGPPQGPLLVLAHGAGADMHHRFMGAFARGLAEQGIRVLRFNFLYTERGRRAPDRAPVLEATFRGGLQWARERAEGEVFIGGKSMGGRIASQIAAAGEEVGGLVYLGYPLHPPGRPERIRDAHLYGVTAPMLFVEGTRDPFCPLETLGPVLQRLERADLHVIDDGDHSFKVRKSSGRSDAGALQEAVDAVAAWISSDSGPG